MRTLAVTIPTRNRPEKLRKCLNALAKAQEHIDFKVYVCDSSDTEESRNKVASLCNEFEFIDYHEHDGKNVAAARNFAWSVATEDLIVNVDDDIYVEEYAIKILHEAYSKADGTRIMAGSVAWGEKWSQPIKMRWIGYGRLPNQDEEPDFVVGAFFLYPRELAQAFPWNEHIRTSDDRFMGALWRGKGVRLLYEKDAKAFHDDEHNSYGVTEMKCHIYTNLFDSLIANPNVLRAFSYEFLGFLAGSKLYFRRLDSALKYIFYWTQGHILFFRDLSYLNQYINTPVPIIKDD